MSKKIYIQELLKMVLMPDKNNNTWEHMKNIFHTRNIATLGIVFAPRPEFHGKPVTSITISQYVLNTKPGVMAAIGKETSIIEPLLEMNGIFVQYDKNEMPYAIETEGKLLQEIISLINHNDAKAHSFFVDVLSRDMTFWSSGASMERIYFSSLEEIEKHYKAEFRTPVGDDMRIPSATAAHAYFEPKIKKLVELIEGYRDLSGKADARTVHKLLKQHLNLNSDDAWSVFDYAMKFKVIEEADDIYVRFTGKRLPSIGKSYDWT